MNPELFIQENEKLFQFGNKVYKITKPLDQIISEKIPFKFLNPTFYKIKKETKLDEYSGDALNTKKCNLCSHFKVGEDDKDDCFYSDSVLPIEEIVVQRFRDEFFMMSAPCIVDINNFLIAQEKGYLDDFLLKDVEPGKFKNKKDLQYSIIEVEKACDEYKKLFKEYEVLYVQKGDIFSNN